MGMREGKRGWKVEKEGEYFFFSYLFGPRERTLEGRRSMADREAKRVYYHYTLFSQRRRKGRKKGGEEEEEEEKGPKTASRYPSPAG